MKLAPGCAFPISKADETVKPPSVHPENHGTRTETKITPAVGPTLDPGSLPSTRQWSMGAATWIEKSAPVLSFTPYAGLSVRSFARIHATARPNRSPLLEIGVRELNRPPSA